MKRVAAVMIGALALGCGGSPSSPGEAEPASVVITPEDLSLSNVGETAQLSTLVRDKLTNGIPFQVQWSTTNASVATVSGSGKVTAVSCGFARVIATARTVADSAFVSVSIPDSDPAKETIAPSLGISLANFEKFGTTLYRRDITVGTGATLTTGRNITMRYKQWLLNGTALPGGDLKYVQGIGAVPVAIELGSSGMRVGGRRTVVTGSAGAYGKQSPGDAIPCSSSIVFELELVSQQ